MARIEVDGVVFEGPIADVTLESFATQLARVLELAPRDAGPPPRSRRRPTSS